MLTDLVMLAGQRIGKPPGFERVIRMFWPPEKCRAMAPRLMSLRGEPLFFADPRTPLGWHVLFFGTYEPELRSFLNSFLQPGYVAIDVGANVGWHTLLMAMKVGRNGRIVAFEPNPSVRKALIRHLELNRFSQVRVLPYALSDEESRVKFFGPPADDPGNGDGFIVHDPSSVSGSLIEVEARALDRLLPNLDIERLDFVKMDIEGFEYRALLGMAATIEQFGPVITFEFNASYLDRCEATPETLGKLIAKHGYQTFVIGRSGLMNCSYTSWPACCDVIAIPKSPH